MMRLICYGILVIIKWRRGGDGIDMVEVGYEGYFVIVGKVVLVVWEMSWGCDGNDVVIKIVLFKIWLFKEIVSYIKGGVF